MGVARRTAIGCLERLVKGDDGMPVGLRKSLGRKVEGHRREANTYTVFIREGWALSAYSNGSSGALVHDDHQSQEALPGSTGDPAARGLVHEDHYVGDPRAQVLPLYLPETSAKTNGTVPETAPLELSSAPTSGQRKKRPSKYKHDPSTEVVQVFSTWLEVLAPVLFGARKVDLTDERRAAIEKALSKFECTPTDLMAAIRGARTSRFHCGENDSGTVHLDLPTIFKTAGRIETHIARLAKPSGATSAIRANGQLKPQQPAGPGQMNWQDRQSATRTVQTS